MSNSTSNAIAGWRAFVILILTKAGLFNYSLSVTSLIVILKTALTSRLSSYLFSVSTNITQSYKQFKDIVKGLPLQLISYIPGIQLIVSIKDKLKRQPQDTQLNTWEQSSVEVTSPDSLTYIWQTTYHIFNERQVVSNTEQQEYKDDITELSPMTTPPTSPRIVQGI